MLMSSLFVWMRVGVSFVVLTIWNVFAVWKTCPCVGVRVVDPATAGCSQQYSIVDD